MYINYLIFTRSNTLSKVIKVIKIEKPRKSGYYRASELYNTENHVTTERANYTTPKIRLLQSERFIQHRIIQHRIIQHRIIQRQIIQRRIIQRRIIQHRIIQHRIIQHRIIQHRNAQLSKLIFNLFSPTCFEPLGFISSRQLYM
jgi:hypothetical protein